MNRRYEDFMDNGWLILALWALAIAILLWQAGVV